MPPRQEWEMPVYTVYTMYILIHLLSREQYSNVSDGLRQCYRKVLRPFEETSLFHSFHSPALEDADFDAKPIVMLVGQVREAKNGILRIFQLTSTLK